MPNRLAQEQSPYLLQHKDNPVDWYPWGEEAFAKARKEDKPIFLSIGYSTCHWCHVMEHESFEDEEVARLMNETFVSIKVDREERPDIDNLYMTVCQMMTGQGGWPLNVLLTPEKEPFHAMTYVPRQGRFGRIGMLELVPRIQQLWTEERERVLQSARQMTGALRETAATKAGEALDEEVLDEAFERLSNEFDAAYGGFGAAPKFPSPHNLLFLLRYWKRTGTERALKMVTTTLDHMRRGGIFDHVGYGFHRYSTDARWLLPHFEKMLYDQAMLIWVYTEAYQATGKEAYRETAEQVITYVLRDMTGAEGGFYSAEDADSEGQEGKFYVWSEEEVHELLPEELADLVVDVYNFESEGNFVEEATQEKTGDNILHLDAPLADTARHVEMEEEEMQEQLETARQLLFDRREQRERPGRDDKVLTDWNGLMIGALTLAARAFDREDYAAVAERAARFLLETMRDDQGRLLHRYRNGEAAIQAHLDDYAFLLFGLTELYETTFEVHWLREAQSLAEKLAESFEDRERGGFYLTAEDAEELIVRQKDFQDGALPSGNAMALLGLIRLARLTGATEWEERAHRTARAVAEQVRRQPLGYTALLMGLSFVLGPSYEVVVAGTLGAEDTKDMLRALRGSYEPHKVVLFRPADAEDPPIAELAPFVREQRAREGRATAYVCHDFQCQAPTTDPEEMLAAMEE